MEHLRTRHRVLIAAATATLVTVPLAGCAAGTTSGPHHHTAATVTSTVTPTVTTTPAASGATATPSAPAPATTAARSGPGTRASTCTSSQLSAKTGERDGQQPGTGSGMSQQRVAIILTNTGATSCTLQGWPGVSYVGDGNGTQIGAPAKLDRGVPHPTVTLQHGAAAQAYIDIADAAVFDPAECKPVHPDGLRVYPPGSRTSIFLRGGGSAGDGTACSSTKDVQMSVDAFIPYP
ncbi:DUF4232 domain-containing protein [Curtobacterium sp. MCBD17_003]|uniref:DUF4232 domain-containing protein n=1 Tax=Curtobacterium sp. MCBD17_003 TaxID=2175667 RepID=UPI000DA8CFBC|nr:DUF4232 domain-containing protein [Curtobacterium sp. MCBD17_003]WIE54038.1 DUF4232 domain-containing protein [Curtobacterium sp. MCBD17_003]